MIVLKNTTLSDINLISLGITVVASSSFTVNVTDYMTLATEESITELTPFISSGDIVVNDGTQDLNSTEALNYITYNHDAKLEKNFYVAKNGNDLTADGSISHPFASIGACITYINANLTLGATENAVIRVAAGEYIEDTLVLPEFCSLWGHHYRTRIKASATNIDLIQSSGSHTIRGVLLTGVTDISKYLVRINTTAAKRVTLQDVSFSDYESVGTISNAIYINSTTPTTSVRLKQVDFEDITNTLIHLDSNCKVFVRGAQVFDCSSATFLDANNNSAYSLYDVDIEAVNLGVDHKNSEASDANNVNLTGAEIPIRKLNANPLTISGVTLEPTKAQILTLEGVIGAWFNIVEGDTSFNVSTELSVGTSNKGKESTFGEGDSYTVGMRVYTSDGTDTSSTEGTLTDVTSEASAIDTDHFGFEGTSANHCIYVATDIQNDAFGSEDYARITGLKVEQVVACVEPIEKSIVFESWNGSAWVEGATFCNESSKFYRYGNDLFIRANSNEHIRFGLSLITTNNVKKTILGLERYWIRIRIKNNVTTAPTFNKFKISNNRTEINGDGTLTFHGLSRHLVALSFQSNTFGETGGVTNANFQVGAFPGVDYPHDNWTHSMKNNQLNGANDAIYANAIIPEGCCTSCPFQIKVKYIVLNSGASADGELKVSAFFARAEGVDVADRAGAIVPISRTVADADSLNVGSAQTRAIPIPLSTDGKVLTAPTARFDASNYYEGDLVFIRIGLNDGGDSKKIAIIGIDVEYLKWTLGTRL